MLFNILWYNVPIKLTITQEQYKLYYNKIRCDQNVATFIESVNNPTHRLLSRGSLQYITLRHRWKNSETNGGYIEAVALRYLRLKNNNNAGIIVDTLCEKYNVHRRTRIAVLNRFNIEVE